MNKVCFYVEYLIRARLINLIPTSLKCNAAKYDLKFGF